MASNEHPMSARPKHVPRPGPSPTSTPMATCTSTLATTSTSPGGSATPGGSAVLGQPDLGDFGMVPTHQLSQPEYCYTAKVNFSKTVKKSERLYEFLCLILVALLNATGGILKLTPKPGTPCTSDMLDQWQRDLGQKLSSFIKDREHLVKPRAIGNDICIYVRKSPGITTLKSYCFVKDGPTSTEAKDSERIARIMQQETKTESTKLPDPFHYEQQLPLHECEELEFKCWDICKTLEQNKNNKTLPSTPIKLYEELIIRTTKDIFALSNNRSGGTLVIGVHDKGKIIGQALSITDEPNLISFLTSFFTVDPVSQDKRIWGEEGVNPIKGTHWDIDICPVHNAPGSERSVLIILHLYHCKGGVFERCPESYTVNPDATVRQLTFTEWRDTILSSQRTEHEAPQALVSHLPASVRPRTIAHVMNPDTTEEGATGQIITLNKDEVNKNLRKESSLSWIDCHTNWQNHIDVRSRELDHSVAELARKSEILQQSSPHHFTPDETVIREACPGIEPALDAMKDVRGEGCVLVSRNMLKCFSNTTQLPHIAEHVIDALMMVASTLHFWVVVRNQGDDTETDNQRAFLYQSGRTIKRYLIETLSKWTSITAFSLKCYLFSLSDKEVIRRNDVPSDLVDVSDTSNFLRRAIAHMYLSMATQIKSIFDDDLSIYLTAEQYQIMFCVELTRVAIIVGPPGTGKSIIAFNMCRYFGRDRTMYIVSSGEFKAYVDYLNVCHTAQVKDGEDLQRLVCSGQLTSMDCIILDDVQIMIYPLEVWDILLMHIQTHQQTHLLLLGDPAVQNFMGADYMDGLCKHVAEFCTTERIPYMTRDLTTVHRNTHKLASYICECTSHIDILVCTSPQRGDGVHVERMLNIRENSGNNELLMYINRLTDPEGQINQGSVTRVFRYRDILVMVDGEETERDVASFRLLLQTRFGQNNVQTPMTYPVTGIRVGDVRDFHGLDAPVCICIVGTIFETIPTGTDRTDPSTSSVFLDRYRAFICSRAIHKMIFITEDISVDLAHGLGYDDLSRFHNKDSSTETKNADRDSDEADDGDENRAKNTSQADDEDQDPGKENTDYQSTAARLRNLLRHQGTPEDMGKLVKGMLQQAAAANESDDKRQLAEMGPYYLPTLLEMLGDQVHLSTGTISDAWLACMYLTWEDNNCQVFVTEGGVNVAMLSLSTQTDTTVVIYILIMLSDIALSHPRELLHETFINTLLGLVHHDQQRISYRSCLVLVYILVYGPSSWTGIDVGKVKSSMMTVMSGWRLEEDMGLGVESALTWYKTRLSNNHPAVQYHTAWHVCYYVTRDPDSHCPIVARDIGLDYLAEWLLSKKSCTEARGLIQTVIDMCKKHHKK